MNFGQAELEFAGGAGHSRAYESLLLDGRNFVSFFRGDGFAWRRPLVESASARDARRNEGSASR